MTLDTFTEQRGQKPYRVTILERVEKGMTPWLRWYVDGKPRYQRTEVRTLRDARGRIQARAVQRVQAEADEKIRELKGETRAPKTRSGPLTLQEGVDLAFSERGPYPLDATKDAWTKEAKARAADAVRLLGGPDLLWEEVTPGMVRAVWRRIEREHGDGSGLNKAEKTLVVLYRIAGWLTGEYPDQRFPVPLKGWRAEMKAHWKKQGHDTTLEQPRFSEAEVRALFLHLPQADPRLLLAMVLGAELRGGQVTRTWRSDMDLSPDAGTGFGVVQIPFVSNRKRAPRIFLNETERAAIDAAMGVGYLSALEAAFKEKRLADYPLFPAGKLRKGRVPVREEPASPMDRSTLTRYLRDLEDAAEVDHIDGRGWHGLRRAFTDLYPTATADARVLDQLGGWTQGSTMREGTYQDKESDTVAAESAALRARVRPMIGPMEGE